MNSGFCWILIIVYRGNYSLNSLLIILAFPVQMMHDDGVLIVHLVEGIRVNQDFYIRKYIKKTKIGICTVS